MKKRLLCLLFVVSLMLGLSGPAFAVEDTAAQTSAYSMKTERPAYDANIDAIRVLITDHSGKGGGYGEEYEFERETKRGWEPVPLKRNSEKMFLGIGIMLLPNQTNTGTISMDWYARPFSPGKYRLIKTVGGEKLFAEFQILPPAKCFRLAEPVSAQLSFKTQAGSGTLTIGPQESPAYVSEVWHELLAFQKGKPAKIPEGIPPVDMTLTLKNRKTVRVALFAGEGRVWANSQNAWYYADDPGVLDRIERKGKELGAFLPADGTALIQALNGLEPLKKVHLTAHQFSIPFAYPGWQSDVGTSGIILSVFQFPSAEELNRRMNYLYDDGYEIGVESRSGGVASFGTQTYHWSEPPHYFKAGSRLVLYNGSDKTILDALEKLLGEQVKTVEEKAAENEKLYSLMESGM